MLTKLRRDVGRIDLEWLRKNSKVDVAWSKQLWTNESCFSVGCAIWHVLDNVPLCLSEATSVRGCFHFSFECCAVFSILFPWFLRVVREGLRSLCFVNVIFLGLAYYSGYVAVAFAYLVHCWCGLRYLFVVCPHQAVVLWTLCPGVFQLLQGIRPEREKRFIGQTERRSTREDEKDQYRTEWGIS